MMGPSKRLALLLARTGAAKQSAARSTVCLVGRATSPSACACARLLHCVDGQEEGKLRMIIGVF